MIYGTFSSRYAICKEISSPMELYSITQPTQPLINMLIRDLNGQCINFSLNL